MGAIFPPQSTTFSLILQTHLSDKISAEVLPEHALEPFCIFFIPCTGVFTQLNESLPRLKSLLHYIYHTTCVDLCLSIGSDIMRARSCAWQCKNTTEINVQAMKFLFLLNDIKWVATVGKTSLPTSMMTGAASISRGCPSRASIFFFFFFIRIYSLVMLPLSSVLQLGEWGIKCYRNLPYECLPTLFIGSNVTLFLIFHD